MDKFMDFEKPIMELEKRIKELENFSKEKEVDLEEEIETLKAKSKEMKNEIYDNLEPWDKVTLARLKERPNLLEYIENIFDSFIELHGDRRFGDDSSIVGGIAEINGKAVTLIGHQKARTTEENIKRNFGMPHPEGYRKALRLMKQAEKFNRPIITFIDTPGAFCGIGAEERGQGEAIAKNLFEMSNLKVPTIAIVIGEGGSGGALALGVADKIAMLEHSVYSVISPEGLASILWKDSKKAKEAAEVMKLTSKDLYELNIIDDIIEEPLGGAHRDLELMSRNIKEYVVKNIRKLQDTGITELLDNRYKKIRNMGSFSE